MIKSGWVSVEATDIALRHQKVDEAARLSVHAKVYGAARQMHGLTFAADLAIFGV